MELEQTFAGLARSATHAGGRIPRRLPRYVAQLGQLKCSLASSIQPADIYWDDQKYRGDAYAAFGWAVYVAEVSVDMSTFDSGRGRFRRAAGGWSRDPSGSRAGQIIGGVAQGIGFAAFEKVAGKMVACRMAR